MKVNRRINDIFALIDYVLSLQESLPMKRQDMINILNRLGGS